MFNSNHYIPILKWKRAEQNALEAMEDKDRWSVTPLIQLVMPKLTPKEKLGKSDSELYDEIILKFRKKIGKIPDEILTAWGGAPIFLDISLLYTVELKAEALKEILLEGEKKGISLIPVIHLSDDVKIINVIKKHSLGVCLRLVCADLDDLKTLSAKLSELLSELGINKKDVDLLVDIKEIADDANKFSKYANLSKKIPDLLEWRTFTFASSAFPEDLSKCRLDEENLIKRSDWINWTNEREGFLRKPSFGDYAIQHPVYVEATQFFAPTTSIKYTLENEWIILKGKKQKFELYLASAKILAGDSRFYGEAFSDGDKFIAEKANHYEVYARDPSTKGTGSTETWLTAGINHHLTVVARQVSTLL